MHSHNFRRAAVFMALPLLSGCGLFGGGSDEVNAKLGQGPAQAGSFGYAVADEPQAALVARQVLNDGGNAADAAAAAGFALSVTLPSRAGLGGGGACIVKMPGNTPVSLMFPPGAPASPGGSRPAAVPTLARGLLALQARYGQLPAASVIVPAERLAAGSQVSPALESDLQIVDGALLDDPAAAAIFAPSGTLLPEGANLAQPELAATLETLRVQNVQGFYSGAFAQQFVTAADAAGGGLTMPDLENTVPHFVPPGISSAGDTTTASIPGNPPPSGPQPATASFAALDKNGGVVACAVTMDNLFGTGRIAQGTGVLLAAAPQNPPRAILAASVTTTGGAFRSAHTGTGQAAISRANVISCPGGVPGDEGSCMAAADPHGQGLAIGGR